MIYGDIGEECEKLSTNSSTFVVVATHGHVHDQLAVESMLRKEYRYLGVIGSRNKIKTMFKSMVEKGYEEELIKGVHSPIGLALGGNSPEDIAVSILAEIIMVKNQGQCITMKEKIMK